MKLHAADAAFLDGLNWVAGTCVMGKSGHQQGGRVVEVDHIEQGSNCGFPVYSCRPCLAYRLKLDRAAAADAGQAATYLPTLQRNAVTAATAATAEHAEAGRAAG